MLLAKACVLYYCTLYARVYYKLFLCNLFVFVLAARAAPINSGLQSLGNPLLVAAFGVAAICPALMIDGREEGALPACVREELLGQTSSG